MYLLTPALWPALVAFVALTVPMLISDARFKRLPLPLNLGVLGAGAALLSFASIWTGTEHLLSAGISFAAASTLLLVLFAISRGGIGFGDVILVAGLSLYSGFISPLVMITSIWVGLLLTAVWVIIRRARHEHGPVPAGPGLIVATLAALLIPLPALA